VILDSRICYRALKARDARFDGRFFVAVSSTRIYCRPVCTVKPPKRENCRFFPSAAAAESGGYRPCLRCRPELAPGNASVDSISRLAQAAASMMEDRTLDQEGLDTIASRLGITDRHLRRAFGAEFGVSPVEFAQTQKLLLAKRLLTDTALPVTEVAFASGFGSVRRFNALFKQRYRLRPGQLRGPLRGGTPLAAAADVLKFELSFRPPFDWSAVSAFLGVRSIAGVETVEDGCYRRTVRILIDGKEHTGWIAVEMSPRKPTLRVAVSASLAKAIETPFDSLTTMFPTAKRVAAISPGSIARLGMPGARARTVVALARAVADGRIALMPNADIEATLAALRALPGVGEWTAQYIAMRALSWPDAFPHTDLGVMKALGETGARRVLAAGEAWRPWRAYAVMHLWQSLTKE